MMSKTDTVQYELTQHMWLLKKLHYDEPTTVTRIDKDTFLHLTTLDAVALYLSTDSPIGTVAAFHSPHDSKLFLASSGPFDPDHKRVSTKFFEVVVAATCLEDGLVFLAQSEPRANQVNKRRSKLYTSLLSSSNIIIQEIHEYQPTSQSLHYAFPGFWSKKFLEETHKDRMKRSEKELLYDLVDTCKALLSPERTFSSDAQGLQEFSRLLVHAKTLLDSDFLQIVYEGSNKRRLLRHLARVTAYLDIRYIIKFWRKYRSMMQVEWVRAPNMAQGATVLGLNMTGVTERYLDVVLKKCVLLDDPESEYRCIMEEELDWDCPGWRGEDCGSIQLCVHAEIRLILHLSGALSGESEAGSKWLAIGSSQKSCLGCTLWMGAVNSAKKSLPWITNMNHGQ
ncbi:hypothetical protein DXG01_009650 [Tephrocybe rancida]|nr:hypothetical protein DXG01_009650 [Tephrocybe rancida]